MVTALQIALLLILIALIGIILGYLFGRLACKKREKSLYFEKSDYCDEQYNKNFNEDESVNKVNAHYNNSLAEAKDKTQHDTVSSGSGATTEGLGIASMTGTAAVVTSEEDNTAQEESVKLKDGDTDISPISSKESESSVSGGENKGYREDISGEKSSEGLKNQGEESSADEESSSDMDNSSDASTVSSGDEDTTAQKGDESTTSNEIADSADGESSADSAKESDSIQSDDNAKAIEGKEAVAQGDDNNNGDDSRSKKQESDSSDSSSEEDSKSSVEEEQNDNESKPATLLEPREGGKDNLCRIKGVGNIIEGKLNNLGVYHFDQIAAWTEKEIVWVDSHLAFSGRILREDWIGQAKLLAEGVETEFSKRVDEGKVSTSQIK